MREALQRLRQIGVIEASASRFTQVADVSPRETANAMIVWLALYGRSWPRWFRPRRAACTAAMEAGPPRLSAAVAALDMQSVATSNFTFFNRLLELSENPALTKAITSVVHIVRLGSLHLPDYLDFAALDHSQQLLLDAVGRTTPRRRDGRSRPSARSRCRSCWRIGTPPPRHVATPSS